MATEVANQTQLGPAPARDRQMNVLGRCWVEMALPTFARLRTPSRLHWWEWGKIAGIVGLMALALLFVTGAVRHPAVVALLLHMASDFSFQSTETYLRKGERGRHLLMHALAAGGLPLAVAGLVTGNPLTVIAWTALGTAGHYAVDWTHKFGLRQKALAVLLDQACHLGTILVLTMGWHSLRP